MARLRKPRTVANLRKVVEEYLNHLEMQKTVNPNSVFFLNGLTQWVWKTGDFRSEEIVSLGSVLTTLIREGKLELNLRNLVVGLYFSKPNR